MDNGQAKNDEKTKKQNKRKIAKKREKRIKQNIKNRERQYKIILGFNNIIFYNI